MKTDDLRLRLSSDSICTLRQNCLAAKVKFILNSVAIPFATTGGQALVTHGAPGSLADLDILLSCSLTECDQLIRDFALAQVILFEAIDTFGFGYPRIRLQDHRATEQLDLIFCTSVFEHGAVGRSQLRLVQGTLLPVLLPIDLFILNLATGRTSSEELIDQLFPADQFEESMAQLEEHLSNSNLRYLVQVIRDERVNSLKGNAMRSVEVDVI